MVSFFITYIFHTFLKKSKGKNINKSVYRMILTLIYLLISITFYVFINALIIVKTDMKYYNKVETKKVGNLNSVMLISKIYIIKNDKKFYYINKNRAFIKKSEQKKLEIIKYKLDRKWWNKKFPYVADSITFFEIHTDTVIKIKSFKEFEMK